MSRKRFDTEQIAYQVLMSNPQCTQFKIPEDILVENDIFQYIYEPELCT